MPRKNYADVSFSPTMPTSSVRTKKTRQKLTGSLKKIIIVEKSMKPRYDENGYLMMGVKEFLLDANSLLV